MNLYAYLGTDEILKKDALEKDLKNWLAENYSEPLAREVYFGSEINSGQVALSYQSLSFFSSKKALILKSFDSVGIAVQNEIAEIIKQPNDNTGIFIVTEKLDGRSSLKNHIRKYGQLLEFKLPYSNKIPGWIVQRAKQKFARQINISSAQFLWEFVGDNTQELELELQKLDTYIQKGAPITIEKIESLLSKRRHNTFFELQKYFGLRNKNLAFKALKNMLDTGEQPILISIKLFNHFITLLKITFLLEQRVSPQDIPGKMKINDFIFKKEQYLDQAKTRSQKTFKKIISKLSEIEYNLKSGFYTYNFEIELEFSKLV